MMTTVSRLIHFFIVLTCACLIAVVILISRFDSVAAQNSPLGWPDDYRLMPGNLHSHTKYSDGKDVLDDVLDNVIKSNPNYVLGITDHVEQLDDGEWRELLSKTTRASSLNWQKSSFIALRGFEWTGTWSKEGLPSDMVANKGIGHINVYYTNDFPHKLIKPSQKSDDTIILQSFYDWINDNYTDDMICQFNHPSLYDSSSHFNQFDIPFKNPNETAACEKILDSFALIELGAMTISRDSTGTLTKVNTYEGAGNGTDPLRSNEYWYRRALVRGWRVAPVLGEDNHKDEAGRTDLRTGIWLDHDDGNPQQALRAALRKRRTFSSEDKEFSLKFWANHGNDRYLMGDSNLSYAAGEKIVLHVEAEDKGKGEVGTISLVTIRRGQNPAQVSQQSFTNGTIDSTEKILTAERTVTPDDDVICYYIKVVNKDEERIFSNYTDTIISAPIWISQHEAEPIIKEKEEQTGTVTTTVLVMDCSGSMSANTPDGRQKLDVAREAARHYLEIIDFDQTELKATHKVGLISFSSDVTPLVFPTELVEIEVKPALDNIYPTNSTNYGDALDSAIKWMENDQTDSRKILVFLTDGMTNTGPVEHDEFLVDTPDDFLNPLRLYQRLRDTDVKVYTIGFGDTSKTNDFFSNNEGLDAEVLEKIATVPGTGGRYLPAVNSFELDEVYIRSFHDATGDIIFESSGTIAPAQKQKIGPFNPSDKAVDISTTKRRHSLFITPAFAAEGDENQMLVTLTCSDGTPSVELIDPNGVRVDAAYPGAHLRDSGQPACLAIDHPKIGQWYAEIADSRTGGDPAQYQLLVSARLPNGTGTGGGGGGGDTVDPLLIIVMLLGGIVLLLGILVIKRSTRAMHS